MIELYGNKIWNSNTPNKYKKVIIASEDSLDNICQELENSGLNYCAYIFNGEAHIAIGRATANNIDKLDIDYQTVIECNSKVYKTNNIIGTTTYDSIEDKLYRKYNTDFAYKIGQRLTEQGILFSGRIYGKTTTITVDKQYADTLNKISAELKEQRASFMSKSEVVQNESPEESKSVNEKISELHFNESQLSALAPSVKFIQTRNDDNLTDNFVSLFSDCTDFYESQLSALAEIYVDTYRSFSDKSLIFADTSRFNDLKQRFVNDNITAKLTENRGYSTTQFEIIREMVTYGMSESVINLLDYTFSIDEMQNFFTAYKNGSYEDLINLIADIKGTTRTDIEGQIEGGTYTPALPDFNTLEKTLYFQESEVESITYMYYNPDAYSGGQFVITEVSYKQIAEANKEYGDDFSGFFDFLDTTGEQRLIDIGSESFRTAIKKFYSGTEFAEGLNADIQHKLVELAVVPEIKLPEVRKIELIKVGDFYEVRGENAKTVADILDLVSTTRNINGSSVDTVGFPDFKLNDNTELLKTQGFTVNIKYEELAPFYEEHDELDDIDPAVIRQQLEDAGIVNGELVDEDKLNSDPFIQQVMAVAESDAGALNVSSEEIVNQFNSENEIVPINEPEQTESVQEIIRPTITCDWSESPVFENGKTYSVSEFDKLMKNADDEWVEQRQLEIEEYGSENAVAEAYRNGELDNIHLGYEKTKFIVNMPNGTTHTFRQDIGDGDGGVIDFLKQYPQYSGVVKILEADIKLDKGENEKAADLPITESKEREVRSDEKLQSVDELAVEVENAAPSRAEKAEVTVVNKAEPPTLFDMVESSEQTETSVNDEKAKNYVIEDREAVTGAKTKFQNNIAAIKILKQTEAENRAATPEEQGQLSLYSGWGGLANAFESDNDKWKNEYSELKGLLTDEEYTAARSTVLDSFYTDTAIVDSIYEVIRNAGFEDGNILEPAMGVGNFFGRLPEELRDKVNLYGVEKDSLSGRIAQKLYPQADITIDGFENTRFNDNSFDVAIGNIPFGDFSVNDSKYNSEHLKIHDYFFLKSLDKVRDGGIVAFVTSKGTLDKKDSSFRKTLAERADLVGAVRLPNNAFKSAGTEVTADIIFLQKREKKSEIEPSWVHTGQLENGLTVNNYFVEHPEMILGEVVEGNKMFGRTDDTMCVPFNDGRTLSELLSSAVKNINFEYSASAEKLIPVSEHLTVEPLKLRLQSFYRRNGEIYFYGSDKSGKIVNVSADKALGKKLNHERINSFIDIRDTLRELLDVQQYDNKDSEIAQLQEKLNNCYDSFYSKYGLLHSSYNHSLLNSDGAYPLVASLEADFAKDNNLLVKKSDIFTERVNKPTATINHVDTAEEALAVCVAEKGVIDFEYMSQITDVPPEDLKIGLREKGEIFAVPSYTGDEDYEYQTASEYLSGDIYAKLDMAKAYASVNGIYESNVVALKEVLPTPLKAGDIDINLGATWIDKKYYEQFMYEIFETPQSLKSDYVSRFFKSDRIELDYSEYSGRWNITNKRADLSVTTVKTYGASGLSAYQIFESVLNLSEPKVYKDKVDEYGVVERDKNNKPVRVLDVEATQVVQQKANAIRREFKNWIFKDANRRRDIVDTYNRTFNCVHAREYDGSHLNFPGMNSNIQLHEHQKNAIAHAIYGGNTLFAHSVGAGKTFEMIATAMECKRLGLCHKSLFAVPNHLTEQVGADFLKLYPNANILVATKDDFKSSNRKMLMSKIATGNYDAVVIGHTQLKMLPLSPERQEAFLQSQIDDIVAGLAEMKAQDGNKFTVKEMERTKKNLENQLEKLQSSKKDNTVYFEELGIDKLFVDEAHEFKNLYCATKLQNVSGISSRASQRATELFAKCRYLDEKTGGKGVVFATGTPLSNSVTELHTMMRYLNYDFLASHNNMQNFDNWISAFGVQKKEYELAPAGNKFKERTRIAEYSNLPELMSMFKMVADVKTAETLKLKVPDCELHIVDVEPTELQKELVDELSDRADEVNSGSVDPSQDNMLKITGDGRKLGLDPRLISPDFEDNPNTKLNVCVNNVFDIYTDTAKDKLTQIVFCDLGVPSKNTGNDSSKEQNDNKSVAELDSLEETGKFCVYDDIRDKLIAKGIPATEIAYIHNAKTEAQKSELFSKVRSGEVRILLGSTGKMGTGTNVQDRIIALHDLDVPWRPADLEQRRGRMVRQGNINEKVHLYRYVTKGTFDAYSYQLLETKQKFISQVMTDKAPARKCADVDQAALSYGEIKALCTGDDRIREKLTLDNRVKELNSLKADYNNTKYELEDAVAAYPEKRKQLLCTIGNIKSDIDNVKSFVDKDGKLICKLTLGSQTFNLKNDEERKNAAKALTTAVAQVRIADNRKKQVSVGNICGFDISVINNGNVYDDIVVTIKGKYSYSAQLGVSAVHNLSKIEGLLYKTESVLDYSQNSLNKLDLDYKTSVALLEKPFEYEAELQEKSARLSELTKILNIELAHQKTESKPKTHYFGKDKILGRNKSSKQIQNKTVMKSEPKRSEPEL
jgi:N12 class adenine-specific DNA methylase